MVGLHTSLMTSRRLLRCWRFDINSEQLALCSDNNRAKKKRREGYLLLRGCPVSISVAMNKQYLDYYGGNNYNSCRSIVYEITKRVNICSCQGILCNTTKRAECYYY